METKLTYLKWCCILREPGPSLRESSQLGAHPNRAEDPRAEGCVRHSHCSSGGGRRRNVGQSTESWIR